MTPKQVPRTARTKIQPPKRKRTKWQLKRDRALMDNGYTKADVWRECVRVATAFKVEAPSQSSVRAVLDGRYRDERVIEAFARLCALTDPAKVTRYFPEDEPPYRGQ